MAIGLAGAGTEAAGVYHEHAPEAAARETWGVGRRFLAIRADLGSIDPIKGVIASMLSFQGGILIPSDTASKSGVRALTHLLANERAAHNIDVNAVAPGYLATSNTAAPREDPHRAPDILARIPAGRRGVRAGLAAGRLK